MTMVLRTWYSYLLGRKSLAAHVRSLVNSAKLLRNLACRRVNLTTLPSIGTPVQVSFYW